MTADYIDHRINYVVQDRRTEIARLTRRRQLSFIIWIASTWLVFMYLWVSNYNEYAPPEASLSLALMASLIPAVLGGFFYFNERRTLNPKIQRLMKYELLFEDFIEAMYRDMERNDAEKGDSWLTMEIEELRIMQNKKYLADIGGPTSKEVAPIDQAKLANYCAMLYTRALMDLAGVPT